MRRENKFRVFFLFFVFKILERLPYLKVWSESTLVCIPLTYKPRHDKTQQNKYAPSEDSDQPGHPPSLIRVFAVRMKKPSVLSYPLSAQWRLGGCPGWSESSLGAHAFCWFCHEAAHIWIKQFLQTLPCSNCIIQQNCTPSPLKNNNWVVTWKQPTKWLCPAKTQISLGTRPVWS